MTSRPGAGFAASDTEKGLPNFNFALGVGMIRVSKPDVRDTIVDNGVLRVTDSEKNKLGFWASTKHLHLGGWSVPLGDVLVSYALN